MRFGVGQVRFGFGVCGFCQFGVNARQDVLAELLSLGGRWTLALSRSRLGRTLGLIGCARLDLSTLRPDSGLVLTLLAGLVLAAHAALLVLTLTALILVAALTGFAGQLVHLARSHLVLPTHALALRPVVVPMPTALLGTKVRSKVVRRSAVRRSVTGHCVITRSVIGRSVTGGSLPRLSRLHTLNLSKSGAGGQGDYGSQENKFVFHECSVPDKAECLSDCG